jgi:sugar-specific transcriptional regulator TrmB
MDTQILSDIGLTNAEIKVYIALLELGTSTAGPIIVHMTLNRLVERGLVSFITAGQRRHYQASNPKHIIQYIDEKKERFNELLPALLQKQNEAKAKPEVVSFKGIKGIKELLYELLDAGGKEHHTFGSTKESLMLGGPWWVTYHMKRAEQGIHAKLLFNESLKSWKAEIKYPKSEVRYTAIGFEPLTETIIRNDKIGILIWTKKPVGVLIHNAAAALSYDSFFKMLWKQAKE